MRPQKQVRLYSPDRNHTTMQKKYRFIIPAVGILLGALVVACRPDATVLSKLTAGQCAREAFVRMAGILESRFPGGTVPARLEYHGPARFREAVLEHSVSIKRITPSGGDGSGTAVITAWLSIAEQSLMLRIDYTAGGSNASPVTVTHHTRVPDVYSLLPPLLTLLLAFVFQRFVPALAAGIVAGAMLLHTTGNPVAGLWHAAVGYMVPAFTEEFSLLIFFFIFFLLSMVQVMTRSGGIEGLVSLASHWVRGPRSARVFTFIMGLAVFFDDYTNCMIVGNTMRPLCDRWKVSREKLAYLVDSTAAPLAGLAVVSTWIGFEVGLLQRFAGDSGLGAGGYAVFLQMLPFRFYCISCLVVVAVSLLLNRDVGPMLRVERQCSAGGVVKDKTLEGPHAHEGKTSHWSLGVVPIAVVVACIPALFFIVGGREHLMQGRLPNLFSLHDWKDAFLGASRYSLYILTGASLGGLLVAAAQVLVKRRLTLGQTFRAAGSSISIMKYAVAVLVLAWAIRDVCADLGTALYLTALLKNTVNPLLIPLGTFIIAASIAFATGTSFGTMGILLPTIAPVAFQLGDMHITLLCLAAILDGSIFGDHCSPVSDTTIISSLSAGCDTMGHVITQIPYGLLAAGLAVAAHAGAVYGLLPVSVLYGCIALAAILFFLVFGRRPGADE